MHQKIVRVDIMECGDCWCMSALDSYNVRHQYSDLIVQIGPFDVAEKRLGLAKERAAILAYEEGLQEYYILRSGRQPERIELMEASMIQADYLELKETDQAEMLLSGKLIRFSGWNGLRFERFNIVSSVEYSLAASPIYTRMFARGQAVFYRLRSVNKTTRERIA